MLNAQKGNMYDFVTHTWNPIKGKCSHACSYCYMRQERLKPLRLEEKELKDDLGKGNFIFVGSSTDMFAEDVPEGWILQVLKKCGEHDNSYLFQTKNPKRFHEFFKFFPERSTFGTTIETNRSGHISKYSKAPSVEERALGMKGLKSKERMLTIEPIMDFDIYELMDLIRCICPKWVNIGADSKRHGLPEPDLEKIFTLKEKLAEFTEVKQKKNLSRLKDPWIKTSVSRPTDTFCKKCWGDLYTCDGECHKEFKEDDTIYCKINKHLCEKCYAIEKGKWEK